MWYCSFSLMLFILDCFLYCLLMLDAIEQVVLAYGAESDRVLGIPGEVRFIKIMFCAFV